jgi:hypothetical protein
MTTTYLNIPNTSINHDKVRQAVAQFMVEEVLTKDQIMELVMTYLEDSYAEAGHSIGDLAKMVKETDIPKPYTHSPTQPNRILCHGKVEGDYYFYTRESDYEYNTLEVKEEVR